MILLIFFKTHFLRNSFLFPLFYYFRICFLHSAAHLRLLVCFSLELTKAFLLKFPRKFNMFLIGSIKYVLCISSNRTVLIFSKMAH
jgi:hypothetical protein